MASDIRHKSCAPSSALLIFLVSIVSSTLFTVVNGIQCYECSSGADQTCNSYVGRACDYGFFGCVKVGACYFSYFPFILIYYFNLPFILIYYFNLPFILIYYFNLPFVLIYYFNLPFILIYYFNLPFILIYYFNLPFVLIYYFNLPFILIYFLYFSIQFIWT
jgi:hypothetical protein